MIVEVGFVTGTIPAIGPIGSATLIIPLTLSSIIMILDFKFVKFIPSMIPHDLSFLYLL